MALDDNQNFSTSYDDEDDSPGNDSFPYDPFSGEEEPFDGLTDFSDLDIEDDDDDEKEDDEDKDEDEESDEEET
jgi:hypothetical protein